MKRLSLLIQDLIYLSLVHRSFVHSGHTWTDHSWPRCGGGNASSPSVTSRGWPREVKLSRRWARSDQFHGSILPFSVKVWLRNKISDLLRNPVFDLLWPCMTSNDLKDQTYMSSLTYNVNLSMHDKKIRSLRDFFKYLTFGDI